MDPNPTDGLLGRAAVQQGQISQSQLDECIRLQELSKRVGRQLRLGEILVANGFLTAEQVLHLLSSQGKRMFECRACRTRYNVAATVEPSALRCRRCGEELIPFVAVPTPSAAAPAQDISADGTWYGDDGSEPEAPPAPAAPGDSRSSDGRGVPDARARTSRTPTRTRRPGAEPTRPASSVGTPRSPRYVEHPSGRKSGSRAGGGIRKVWLGLLVLGVVVAVALLISRGKDGTSPKRDSEAATTPDPATGPPVHASDSATGPQDREYAQLLQFVKEHAEEPAEVVRHLRESRSRFLGTSHEEELLGMLRAQEEPLLRLGAEASKRRLDEGATFEREGHFGRALAALADLTAEQDPLGDWNVKLAKERERVQAAAMTAWARAKAEVEALANKDALDEAIATVRPWTESDVPQTQDEARKMCADLTERASKRAATEGPSPDPPPPAAGQVDPVAQARDRALALAGKDLTARRFGFVYKRGEKLVADPNASPEDKAAGQYMMDEVKNSAEKALAAADALSQAGRHEAAATELKKLVKDFDGTPWKDDLVRKQDENVALVRAANLKKSIQRMSAPELLRLGVAAIMQQACYRIAYDRDGARRFEGIVHGAICHGQTSNGTETYSAGCDTFSKNAQGNWGVEKGGADARLRCDGQNPEAVLSLLASASGGGTFDAQGSVQVGDVACKRIVLDADKKTIQKFLKIVYNTESVSAMFDLDHCQLTVTLDVGVEDGILRHMTTSESTPGTQGWTGKNDTSTAWDFTDFDKNLDFEIVPDLIDRLKGYRRGVGPPGSVAK